ncbi:MAG: hypothetical protein QHJ34_09205 [bacterium]|nr:hypothetical protein [candidate division KSB1 bacterium]MDH7560393.1 hypothetical protein [bacterium]
MLSTLWLNPQVASHLPPAKGAAPSSEWGRRLANFPFDSLLAAAEVVVIDLHRVPRRALRLVRSVGDKEVPPPGSRCWGHPLP